MREPWPPDVDIVIVDGNNVMGAAADGWWRDRPAAVRRLLGRLQCSRRDWPGSLILVLDVRQADLGEGDHDGVEVRYPRRAGRNAADDRIVELLDDLGAPSAPSAPGAPGTLGDLDDVDAGRVGVVSSDRALIAAARRRGATTLGAGTFLAHLDAAGADRLDQTHLNPPALTERLSGHRARRRAPSQRHQAPSRRVWKVRGRGGQTTGSGDDARASASRPRSDAIVASSVR